MNGECASGGEPGGPVELDAPPPAAGPVRSVYVHVPFTAREDPYRGSSVSVSPHPDPSRCLRAVGAEWAVIGREGRFDVDSFLDTLYVGGGDPSLLGPDAMAGLLDGLGGVGVEREGTEWTVEADPGIFSPELARGWRRAGVNRISLAVRSFHGPSLRWLGRLHGPGDAERAVEIARDAGITEVSADLCFGLPQRLERPWSRDLDRLLFLDVPHVSLRGLGVEDETGPGKGEARAEEDDVREERFRQEFLEASECLRREGYVQYEVTSFARPGHVSRHNRMYWSGRPYLGLGNGAHSYSHPLRRWNLTGWRAYSSAVREGRLPLADRERIDRDALRLERIWAGLRTRRGLAVSPLPLSARRTIRRWSARGWAKRQDDSVHLTPEGWLMLDHLIVDLAAVMERDSPDRDEGSTAVAETSGRDTGREIHG